MTAGPFLLYPTIRMVSDVFTLARTRLLQGWCRGAIARTAYGEACHPNNPHAAAWSLHGAIMRAAHELGLAHTREAAQAREAARRALWTKHHMWLMWLDDGSAARAVALLEHLLAQDVQ